MTLEIDSTNFKSGSIFKIDFGKGSRFNQRIHIENILERWGEVIYRFWSRTKQRWIFRIEPWYFFETLNRNGFLKLIKRGENEI